MSESLNNPQPFDVVLGGNNTPKSKSTTKKVEKPKLKKKIDSTDNKNKASSPTKIKQSSNNNRAENINASKSSKDKTESYLNLVQRLQKKDVVRLDVAVLSC